MTKLMIYGATGYTGRMVAEHAKAAGTQVVLAGRNEEAVSTLAAELDLEYRVFGLEDATAIDRGLAEMTILLNCAGPFMRTANALMKASIRSGAHYLDTSAELDSYRLAEEIDRQAKAIGVMLMPGGGGSVAMLGSLAGHAVDRVIDPRKIRIALHVTGGLSRGSAISAMENVTTETLARIDGDLVRVAADGIAKFDFGKGAVDCIPVTLPDLVTIWRATGVPDVETFVHVTGDGFPKGELSQLPDGPSQAERLANRYQAAVEVTDADGQVTRSRLDTVNGYTFTAMAAAAAGRRVLEGEVCPGFQTPAALFAADAVIDDVSVGDAFVGSKGVRDYLERFFVGYNTSSRLLTLDLLDEFHALVRLDFTGDFGHEVGVLKVAINLDGRIERIDADLQ